MTMRQLDPPVVDDAATYIATAAKRQEPARSHLQALTGAVTAAYESYTSLLPAAIPAHMTLDAGQSTALKGNYSLTYSPGSLSWLRSKVLLSAPFGRCPYCDNAQATTLDHYLPQGIYEEYCILSINLIPACHRCNNQRNADFAEGATLMWHAYLDEIPQEPVLVAQLLPVGSVLAAAFAIENKHGADTALVERLDLLFRSLDLANYFSLESANFLYDLAPTLSRRYAIGGDEAVNEHLVQAAEDYRRIRGQNAWVTALSDALIRVPDFSAHHFDTLVRQDIDWL